MTNKRFRAAAYSVATTAALIGSLMVTASPAQAIGGNCSAGTEKQSGLDNYRGWASCSSLQGDTKARPKLVRDGGPDYTGSYFTALNTRRYTSYYSCWMGCHGAVELAHV